jgi:hypothetical protein
VTCASSIQQAGCAQRGFRQAFPGAALADLALAVDRGFPGGFRDLAERGLLAGALRPADGPGDLVPVPGGEPVELFDQLVAGAGPVAGHHQP